MRKHWWIIGAALAAAGCGGNNDNSNYLPMSRNTVTPEAVDKATKSLTVGKAAKVSQGAMDFGFQLFRQVAGPKPADNVFLSPVSAAMALGMTYNGAAAGTKDAFEKVLGFENTLPGEVNQAYKDLRVALVGADPKVTVHVANALWTDREFEFKREFLARNSEFFAAKVQAVEMSQPGTVEAINAWVKEQTEEKIPSLFDKLDPDTKAVLVNAVYFHGAWQTPFPKEGTKDREFTAFDGKAKSIPMMSRTGHDIDYLKSEKFAAVRLPYGNGRLQMAVLLPNSGVAPGALIQDLNAKNWAAWSAKFKPMEGTVVLPKWKSADTYELKAPLSELGLAVAFDPAKADFSLMANVRPGQFVLTRVVQKTTVEVAEEGTEASAATGVEVGVTSAPMPVEKFEFVANRPFVYLIADKTTGAILFLGVYGKP